MIRFTGTVEEFLTLDPQILGAVILWITAIPLEDWGQQKPAGVYPLKPAMMSNHTWHNFGEAIDPLVNSILVYYPDCIPLQQMLGVVMPGDIIPVHIDHQCEEWVERIHIPLTTNPKAVFRCDDGEHHMEVGKAYRVNTEARHEVFNGGDTPRIHLMFDVRGK
jgi:hypothetical protein